MVANQDFVYRYVSRWSDVDTWGPALKPLVGESVSVPTGRNLLVDEDTPDLNLVILDGGSLIFECSDPNATPLTMSAKYIFVNEGSYMEIGTEDQPCLRQVTITLHGAKYDPVMPLFGNKVIAVNGGQLEMHGRPIKNTWTRLSATVNPLQTILTVVDDCSDWQVGDRIVIASTWFTDGGIDESEVHEIAAVAGTGPTTI